MRAGASLDGLPIAAGVRHRLVDLGDVTLHVATWGDPAAPPVLLLHGWPQHWWEWRAVAAQLAPAHHVIAPDHRGFGWSDAPGRGYDATTFGDDAVRLLDALDVRRAAVIGHDWGGIAAFLLALRHPDRVAALLACTCPHPWTAPSMALAARLPHTLYAAVLAAPGLGPRAAASRHFVRHLMHRDGRPWLFGPAELEIYRRRLRDPARAHASAVLYRTYAPMVLAIMGRRAHRGRRLQMPHRLLLGSRDVAVPPPAGRGLDAVEVLDTTHWMPEERPLDVVRHARQLGIGTNDDRDAS